MRIENVIGKIDEFLSLTDIGRTPTIELSTKIMIQPLVYILVGKTSKECVYVGSTKRGLLRVLGRHHAFTRQELSGFKLYVTFCKDHSLALQIEDLLIKELKPLRNKVGLGYGNQRYNKRFTLFKCECGRYMAPTDQFCRRCRKAMKLVQPNT